MYVYNPTKRFFTLAVVENNIRMQYAWEKTDAVCPSRVDGDP